MKRNILLVGILLTLWLVTSATASAAPITNAKNVVTQPDGTTLHLLASGDEYFHRLHDGRGYTIVKNLETGWFVYADKADGRLVPTDLVVGIDNPESAGLAPNILPDAKFIRDRFNQHWKIIRSKPKAAKISGTINYIFIFIRFSGESEFTTATSQYTGMLSDETAGANSLVNYYEEVSYGSVHINSHLYPTPNTHVVSYVDSHTRSYYQPYSGTNTQGYSGDEQRGQREQAMLNNAVAAAQAAIPDSLDLDTNNDGYVDGLAFVIHGQADGWSDLLWSHMWVMYYYSIYINGSQVGNYTFQMQDQLEDSYGTSVIAHETFHMFGAPDLYRYYDQSITPVGPWDIMAETSNPPTHMSCYLKWKYGGWLASIPEITQSGQYTLQALGASSTNNCYKLRTSQSSSQYFILEYRRKYGTFEGSLPNSGLLVHRINPLADFGNASGPPDEDYLFRLNGGPSSNGDIYGVPLGANLGRASFGSGTNPYPFLANGSSVSDISISSIGNSGGSSMTFSVGTVTVDDQCRACDDNTNPCSAGYTCVGYSGLDISRFCVEECTGTSDTSCPSDSHCASLGNGYYGCAPDAIEGICRGQELWYRESCDNEILYDTCDAGLYCNAIDFSCDATCQPQTCQTMDKTCGSWGDGCDDTVYCGECSTYTNSFCDQTGNCSCGENTCESLNAECGTWNSGCGGSISCGTCGDYSNSYCDNVGHCRCETDSCEDLGVECGQAMDGCGGTLQCGNCDSGYTCVEGACEEDSADGDQPDGDQPDGDQPDGDQPDGDQPDGDQPDGDQPDGDQPDGDQPDGDQPDGDQPDGDTPDGDAPTECFGACSMTDTPFCAVDGSSFCRCVGGQWTAINCLIYCRDRQQVFDECWFDPTQSLEGCHCSGDAPVVDGDLPGDGDVPVDGDLPDGDEPADGDDNNGLLPGTDGGGLCHSGADGNIFMILLSGVLLLWLHRRRRTV